MSFVQTENLSIVQSAESRVAIVTGASRGIGRAVAKGLVEDGYRVAAIGRNEADLNELADELLQAGHTNGPRILALDIRDEAALVRQISAFLDETGRVDLLFNNAAVVRRGTSSIDHKYLEEMWLTNFVAAVSLTRVVVPIMQAQCSGHIINIASRSARFPKAANGGYAASKAALCAFGTALYQELAQHGVKVTTILPSYVDTAQSAGQKWLPDNQKIEPEDILRTVRFLIGLSAKVSINDITLDCTRVVAHGEQYV